HAMSRNPLDDFDPPTALPGNIARSVFADPRPKVQLPGDNRLIADFAAELGDLLRPRGLYRRERLVVTLNEKSDALRVVGEQELRTWVEKYVICYSTQKPSNNAHAIIEIRKTMTNDVSRATIAAPQFIEALSPIEHVNDIPLPTLRKTGKIEMLPQGYDSESQTYTLNKSPISAAPAKDPKTTLDELLQEFCFADTGRSKAVTVSAMMTLFARGLLPVTALRPAFIYLANAPGAGKTLAADCAVVPVFGRAYRHNLPQKEEELEKVLLTAVMEAQPVLFFDNIKKHLSSSCLEGFLTSLHWQGRILSVSKTFSGKNSSTVFLTGNGATVSPDMRRRSLFVELFSEAARAEDRKFSQPLDEAVLVARRGEILGALWQMVKAWDAAGRPACSNSHNGLGAWCNTIAAIVEHAGFSCPTARAELHEGGDTEGDQIGKLITALFSHHGTGTMDFENIVKAAQDDGLFEYILGDGNDSLEMPQRVKFAKLLKRYDRMIFGAARLRFHIQGTGHARKFRITKDETSTPAAPITP
ncbi:MAG TPA: hypothetical protein VL069_15945, partial [Opitutus sp.]|nr:hypothetical protein [Opitutus sp.]